MHRTHPKIISADGMLFITYTDAHTTHIHTHPPNCVTITIIIIIISRYTQVQHTAPILNTLHSIPFRTVGEYAVFQLYCDVSVEPHWKICCVLCRSVRWMMVMRTSTLAVMEEHGKSVREAKPKRANKSLSQYLFHSMALNVCLTSVSLQFSELLSLSLARSLRISVLIRLSLYMRLSHNVWCDSQTINFLNSISRVVYRASECLPYFSSTNFSFSCDCLVICIVL